MQERVKTVLIVFMIIVLSGCSAARKHRSITAAGGSSDAGAEATVEGVRRNNITEKGLIIKRGRVEIEGTGTDGSFSLTARLNTRGDFMVSIKGPFGIELVRILAVGNDIAMIDRINRTVYVGKKDEIMRRNGLPDDFIQTVLGDLPVTGNGRYSKTGNGYILSSGNDGSIEREYKICYDEMKVCRLHLTDKVRERDIVLEYGNFSKSGDIKYPATVVMDDSMRQIRVKLNIDDLSTGYNNDMDFTLPDYRRNKL